MCDDGELFSCGHSGARSVYPEGADALREDGLCGFAFRLVVGIDPKGVAGAGPFDDFAVGDAEAVVEDVARASCVVSDEAKGVRDEWRERVVEEDDGIFRRRSYSPKQWRLEPPLRIYGRNRRPIWGGRLLQSYPKSFE